VKRFLTISLMLGCCLVSGSAFCLAAGKPVVASDVPPNSIQDAGPHTRPSELSLLAYLPWYYGFGIGVTARYSFPVVQNGFISTLNNSVSIEPGLAIEYASYGGFGYTLITPYVLGIWTFYFSDQLRAYGGVGLGWHIGADYGGFRGYIDPVAGGYYKLSPTFSLRGELGYGGPKFGISLAL
jgi:hypothetical protein